MFEFSRSSSAEAERPEPFSQEGPALWSASLRSWDLCFEMDEQDRVIRVGGLTKNKRKGMFISF